MLNFLTTSFFCILEKHFKMDFNSLSLYRKKEGLRRLVEGDSKEREVEGGVKGDRGMGRDGEGN